MSNRPALRRKKPSKSLANIDELELLRSSQCVFDAILFYIHQPHLSSSERDELRGALSILCRGEQKDFMDKTGELG